MFALVDCNNFFASCERVINPRLEEKPIVILSNNDGCIVARSNEAKALGVPMGAPYFKWKAHLAERHVRVFSSNYLLYGDMSRRVMETLEYCLPQVSIYSIDEAFADVSHVQDLAELLADTKHTVRAWTGIPVSIGAGPTKTLAKAANELAKKYAQYNGVLIFDTAHAALPFLEQLPVGDLWGVGRSLGYQLPLQGIASAADFVRAQRSWIHQTLGKHGTDLWDELHGIPRTMRQHGDMRKSVIRSRSFGKRITDKAEILDALTYFADRAGQMLRKEGLRTQVIRPFFMTSRFAPVRYHASKLYVLEEPTHDSTVLIRTALQMGETLFQDGYLYAKAGIVCTDITRADVYQQSLFAQPRPEQAALMTAYDAIRTRFGSDSIAIGRTRDTKAWHMKRALLSTPERNNISSIPTVRCI